MRISSNSFNYVLSMKQCVSHQFQDNFTFELLIFHIWFLGTPWNLYLFWLRRRPKPELILSKIKSYFLFILVLLLYDVQDFLLSPSFTFHSVFGYSEVMPLVWGNGHAAQIDLHTWNYLGGPRPRSTYRETPVLAWLSFTLKHQSWRGWVLPWNTSPGVAEFYLETPDLISLSSTEIPALCVVVFYLDVPAPV